MHKTPCYVIAGPLGVGKTSAILNCLKQQPQGTRVGVLVNDFGPIGLDQVRLGAEAPTTKVVNLHGGCICCTLIAAFPKPSASSPSKNSTACSSSLAVWLRLRRRSMRYAN